MSLPLSPLRRNREPKEEVYFDTDYEQKISERVVPTTPIVERVEVEKVVYQDKPGSVSLETYRKQIQDLKATVDMLFDVATEGSELLEADDIDDAYNFSLIVSHSRELKEKLTRWNQNGM